MDAARAVGLFQQQTKMYAPGELIVHRAKFDRQISAKTGVIQGFAGDQLQLAPPEQPARSVLRAGQA